MKILVAGATGLAGSAVVKEFHRLGESVTSISSKDVNLLDRSATFKYLLALKPNIVVDAAARVGGIGANESKPVEFLSENLQIQTNLMDASHEAGVEKFVFLGSNCIYPRDCPQPIKEEYLLTGELEPTNSAYAIAKIAGLELIKSYRKEFGHRWISLMPINLYGPNDNFDLDTSHVFPALIRKFIEATRNNDNEVVLWGSGTPLREFLHADDLAKAIVICLDRYDESQQINIGTSVETSISDLALNIARHTGFKGKITWDSTRPNGTPRKVLDITKITKLGWKPSITLDQGIASTVEWYLQNK